MCDKELLLDYLYGELQAAQRETFERHLATCGACRVEVDGLRSTRTHLAKWAPPEPDLGFQIVRRANVESAPVARWWRPSPVWGLAAAALIVLSVSAAVANLEVTAGANGVTVRTGWSRPPATQPVTAVQTTATSEQMTALSARLNDLEAQLAARQPAAIVPASAVSGRMTDAEIVRLMRQMIASSEQRQETQLARQILQVSRDTETARHVDAERMRAGLMQIQGVAAATSQRQRAFEDIVRVGFQR